LEQVLSQGGFAGNMAGGTHHSFYAHGSGYCVFNDLAICALHALSSPSINRVLILDLDVHQGDGTASILANCEQAMTVSLHCGKNFPFRKQASDIDVELPVNARDIEYLTTLDELLAGIQFETFDLLLYQAGVDALVTDRLGKLAITRNGLDKRNKKVLQKAFDHRVPTVIFMGGGYAEPITDSVDAFVDLFTAAAYYHSLSENSV
jgi:acetoin utilization deacetylase AcuC-like enzyme